MYTLAELEQLLTATGGFDFAAVNKAEAYGWVEDTLIHYRYHKLGKAGKGTVKRYISKITGYSAAQIKRLIRQWRKTGRVKRVAYARHSFCTVYTRADMLLLASVDQAHLTLSGPATRLILEREYRRFGKEEYKRLSEISVGHLYNLRKTSTYREHVKHYEKTKPKSCPIGERRKPEPNGIPGYIRVDTVHQGDDPITGKGVYHINFIDEVTQWELVATVADISALYLLPALEAVLEQFPFVLHNFHSDNGSEYINERVAEILERLFMQQTKSRPRQSNDNGLVETKNGSIIRKHMGYHHIAKVYAQTIDRWQKEYVNVYLNFHRPCAFPVKKMNNKGKEIAVYPLDQYMIPYEKLKSLPNATSYLKEGVTFDQLDKTAYAQSDTEFAVTMQEAKRKLFATIKPTEKIFI